MILLEFRKPSFYKWCSFLNNSLYMYLFCNSKYGFPIDTLLYLIGNFPKLANIYHTGRAKVSTQPLCISMFLRERVLRAPSFGMLGTQLQPNPNKVGSKTGTSSPSSLPASPRRSRGLLLQQLAWRDVLSGELRRGSIEPV